jgi:hypothetical protein
MLAQIIPVHIEKELPQNTPPNLRVPWPYAVACCLYYLLAYRGLASATSVFAELFKGLGLMPPLPTRLLVANYSWFFPILFVGALMLTIAKQFIPFSTLRLRVVNLFLIVVAVVFPSLVALTWYLPLFILVYKLHVAK